MTDRQGNAKIDTIVPDDITIVRFNPPAILAPYLTQMHHFRCEAPKILGWRPACLGHLIILFEGDGSLTFPDGRVDPFHPATVFGPGGTAAHFSFSGPLEHFGVTLSPLGFVALTGRPASIYTERAVPAAELFGPEVNLLADQIRERRRTGRSKIYDIVDRITAFLLPKIRPVPPAHIRLVEIVQDWISSDLNPDVETLYAQLPMSRSTASRLVTRYFGSAPKPLMRKHRALRAAAMMTDPAIQSDVRAQVESLFYDQPHMIREIRHFTGRTPGALDSADAEILRIWLNRNNYQSLESYPA